MFRTATSQDPQLTDDVIGIKWRRREAIETFQILQKGLHGLAAAHFSGHVLTGEHLE
jgi:hypothetical protein